ncbi:hypothetical protein V5O48_007905 [Marasmius crinis-equi]|uniref:Uncharacterized protein n=1 Tax=Marasmius crinis-equi TaxID=585013 RepID=A0ABR3FG25_9AGAR
MACNVQKISAETPDHNIIERLQHQPKHFHLESFHGQTILDNTDLTHWFTLKTARCRFKCRLTQQGEKGYEAKSSVPLPFRITGCYCNVDPSVEPSNRESYPTGHRTYQAACLLTAEAFINGFVSASRSEFPDPLDQFLELNHISRNMLDSALLQYCALEPRVFSLCETFFAHVKDCRFVMVTSPRSRNGQRQKELFEWLQTCPDQYSKEAKTLKAQIRALLPTGDDLEEEAGTSEEEEGRFAMGGEGDDENEDEHEDG